MLNWDDPLGNVQSKNTAGAPPLVSPSVAKEAGLKNTATSEKKTVIYRRLDLLERNTIASLNLAEPDDAEYMPQGNGNTGLEAPELGADRLHTDDKHIINSNSDLNQLAPIKYPWAKQRYLDACNNHWSPEAIEMSSDSALWEDPHGLTEDERTILKRNLGFFSTAGSLLANNLVLSVYRHITNPECRQYILRQAFETSLHTHAYQHIVEALGLDEGEIFNMYREVPAVGQKAKWAVPFAQHLSDPLFQTGNAENDQTLLRELIAFYVVFEGIFSHVGFTQVLSMGRRNKMTATAQHFVFAMRDCAMHVNFGIDMINQIKLENPPLWNASFKQEITQMINEAVALETQYAYDTMPRGILGLNAPMFEEYLQFISNRRCAQIGIAEQFPGATNPFPWMSDIIDAQQKSPTDSHSPEHQASGALSWD